MSDWKKIIVSGSNAELNSLYAPSITGSLHGTASWAQNSISSSYALTSSYSKNLQISGSINNVDYIDFNTGSATPAWKSGRVFWDNTDGALSVYNAEADITLQVGQESWVRVFNQTGVTINDGTPVRLVGAQGDIPKIIKAQSSLASGSALGDNQIIGVATHDIETNSIGYVTTQGIVRGLNTSTFNDGDLLFVSSSAGVITNIIPIAPYEVIQVGICVKAGPGGSGIIYVFPTQPIDFGDLASAERGVYQYGDIWSYVQSGSVGVWRHGNQLSGSYRITGSLIISSSNNTNDLQVGTNKLFVSASGNVGIGTTTPATNLDITSLPNDNGTLRVAGSGSFKRGIIYLETNDIISGSGHENGRISFLGSGSSEYGTIISQLKNTTSGSEEGEIIFRVRKPSQPITNSEIFRVTSTGISIGITSSLALLHVKSGSASSTAKRGGSGTIIFSENIDGQNYLELAASTASNAGVLFSKGLATGNYGLVNYNNTDDSMAFLTAGVERMRISGSGNVGIGTTTPIAKLEVNGPAFPGIESVAKFTVSDDVSSSLQIKNGTSAAATFVPEILGTNSTNRPALGISGVATTDTGTESVTIFQSLLTSNTAVVTRPIFQWKNFSTNVMTILADGKVGIGTTTPATNLDVTGVVNSSQARFGNIANRGLEISTVAISGRNDAGSILNGTGDGTNGTLIFQTDDVERVRINAIGNVGIGTTTPNTKLDVNGNTTITGSVNITGSLTLTGSLNASSYSNKILTITELTNNTLVTHTVGTTNFTAINLNSDATNRYAKTSFVAPLSGQVQIKMEFDMTIVNSAAVQMIGLHNTSSATTTPSEGWYRVNADNDSTSGQFYANFIKTGLTPGTTYTYYFMGVCDFSGNTIRTSRIQTGSYVASSDLPSPLRIYVYDLGPAVITTNPST